MSGKVLNYSVEIPRGHPPGLFWYHTHPHGESHRQVLDGMSGAIVIEGMERYVPEVGRLRERVVIVRGLSIEHEPKCAELKRQVDLSSKSCGGGGGGDCYGEWSSSPTNRDRSQTTAVLAYRERISRSLSGSAGR